MKAIIEIVDDVHRDLIDLHEENPIFFSYLKGQIDCMKRKNREKRLRVNLKQSAKEGTHLLEN